MKKFKTAISAFAANAVVLGAAVVPAAVLAAVQPADITNAAQFGAINAAGTSGIVDIKDLATKVINFVLGLLGIIAVIIIVISGFQWMTADSEDKVKEARKRLFNSIIGLAIIALAWVVAFAIVNTLAGVTK
ncbi:MAG: hypothetical protein AAB400_04325 [Patescibacteria group bacterium]